MPKSLTVLQGAAILLCCRLTAFFCCGVPYTAAYAAGMAAAVLVQTLLVLPLVLREVQIPAWVMLLSRIYAFFAGALLLSDLAGLLGSLHMPHPLLTLGFLAFALVYTLRLPAAATARTAVLLLLLAALGFLLLPITGIGTAERLHLYMPERFAGAFLRELRASREFALLPLLLSRIPQKGHARLRTLLIRAVGQGAILPLTVLLGTMQNGRLTGWQGSPFFLLLARTPLSDAFRTDGFWMLLAVGCGLLALTWFTGLSLPETNARKSAVFAAVPALAAVTLCIRLTGYAGAGMGLTAVLLVLASALPALRLRHVTAAAAQN